MQVAAGRADELERARPFGLLAGAFGCVPGSADPRRAAIAGLLSAPGGRTSGGPVTVTSDPGLQLNTDVEPVAATARPIGAAHQIAPRSSYIRFQAELPNGCWQSNFTHQPLADGTGTQILTWLDDHSRLVLSLAAQAGTYAG